MKHNLKKTLNHVNKENKKNLHLLLKNIIKENKKNKPKPKKKKITDLIKFPEINLT